MARCSGPHDPFDEPELVRVCGRTNRDDLTSIRLDLHHAVQLVFPVSDERGPTVDLADIQPKGVWSAPHQPSEEERHLGATSNRKPGDSR